jgi:DNA-binding CsgD family transcriptional regulator
MISIHRGALPSAAREFNVRNVMQDQVRDSVTGLPPSTLAVDLADHEPAMIRLVSVGEDRFRLVVQLLAYGDGEPTPLATMERIPSGSVCQRTLRERYRLTEKETRVAMLLAQRRSNAEIAAALDISPHTARRHTENVMLKLNVSSRFSVETALRAVA